MPHIANLSIFCFFMLFGVSGSVFGVFSKATCYFRELQHETESEQRIGLDEKHEADSEHRFLGLVAPSHPLRCLGFLCLVLVSI